MVTATSQRRFRPRFRLRTFLVLVTLFFVWLGWHIYGARRQREAVEAIREFGGTITYSYQMEGDNYRLDRRSWAPRMLRDWLGIDFFHAVSEVAFHSRTWPAMRRTPAHHVSQLSKLVRFHSDLRVDDAGLAQLSRLSRLKHLALMAAAEVTDEGVAKLSSCDQLWHVTIIGSQTTDDSLALFSQMSDLETLRLPSQNHLYTDQGVSQLRNLKKLRVLDLTRAPDRWSGITDEGLSFLLELDDFDSLHVENTQVTMEFEQKIKARFPQCKVYRRLPPVDDKGLPMPFFPRNL